MVGDVVMRKLGAVIGLAMPFAAATNWNNVAGLFTVDPQPLRRALPTAKCHGQWVGRAAWQPHRMALRLHDSTWFATMKTTLVLRNQQEQQRHHQTLTNAEFDTYENKNAIAILPEAGEGYEFTGGKYLNVVWRFIKLETVP
jgi:hypothetical protein